MGVSGALQLSGPAPVSGSSPSGGLGGSVASEVRSSSEARSSSDASAVASRRARPGSFGMLRDELAVLVGSLDASLLAGSDARVALGAVLEAEKLLGGARLLLSARVAETRSWGGDGARSFEDWLTSRTGGSFGSARRDAETAESLGRRTGLADALRQGALSTDQAAEVASAATADPASEDELVERAKGETLRQTRQRAERVKAAARSAEQDAARAKRQHAARQVRFGTDAEGCATLLASGPPGAVAEVRAELERQAQGIFRTAYAEGRREPAAAYAFDALVEMARRSRTGVAGGGGAGGDDRAPKPKTAVSVVVDLPALRRGCLEPGERCEIPGVGSVPVAWAVEQLGEATLRLFLRHGGDLRAMATTSRTPTEHMKVCLEVLHDGCVVCGNRHHLEIHHTTSPTGWADTRRTRLDRARPALRPPPRPRHHRRLDPPTRRPTLHLDPAPTGPGRRARSARPGRAAVTGTRSVVPDRRSGVRWTGSVDGRTGRDEAVAPFLDGKKR